MHPPRRHLLAASLAGALALAGCSDVTDQVDQAQRGVDDAQQQVDQARDRVGRAGQGLGDLAEGDVRGAVDALTGVQTREVERLVRGAGLRDVSCPADGTTRAGGSLRISCSARAPDGSRTTVPVVIAPGGGVSVGN